MFHGHVLSSIVVFAAAIMAAAPASARNTVLGIEGTRFTLNGSPVFLLGISYYGGLGAPREMVGRDLDAMQKHGFNWLRLWAV